MFLTRSRLLIWFTIALVFFVLSGLSHAQEDDCQQGHEQCGHNDDIGGGTTVQGLNRDWLLADVTEEDYKAQVVQSEEELEQLEEKATQQQGLINSLQKVVEQLEAEKKVEETARQVTYDALIKLRSPVKAEESTVAEQEEEDSDE